MKGIFFVLLVFLVLATLKEQGLISDDALRQMPVASVLGPGGREQPSVVMYATKRCGYCRRARQWMTRNGIDWEERDVEESASARHELLVLGGSGVPTFLIGGSHVIMGFKPDVLREKLR